ncbi:hypothetical protein EV646_101131 [Kribbella antiqua]|uniref:Uncharacterized protein n=1 Tax=Kribbella antiqua TaxID=2512217 RepID=A0A4R2J2Q2_9ACTN|nr:hypothetical protein EV646_101131 [Kribbella antiqua]
MSGMPPRSIAAGSPRQPGFRSATEPRTGFRHAARTSTRPRREVRLPQATGGPVSGQITGSGRNLRHQTGTWNTLLQVPGPHFLSPPQPSHPDPARESHHPDETGHTPGNPPIHRARIAGCFTASVKQPASHHITRYRAGPVTQNQARQPNTSPPITSRAETARATTSTPRTPSGPQPSPLGFGTGSTPARDHSGELLRDSCLLPWSGWWESRGELARSRRDADEGGALDSHQPD